MGLVGVAGLGGKPGERGIGRATADLLARTLVRAEVMVAIRERFPPGRAHAG